MPESIDDAEDEIQRLRIDCNVEQGHPYSGREAQVKLKITGTHKPGKCFSKETSTAFIHSGLEAWSSTRLSFNADAVWLIAASSECVVWPSEWTASTRWAIETIVLPWIT